METRDSSAILRRVGDAYRGCEAYQDEGAVHVERGKAYARGRAAAGATAAEIAGELGIAEQTAKRWLHPQSSTALVPVRVVDDAQPRAPEAGPVVITPSGLRVEGLDLDALCTLVTRCG